MHKESSCNAGDVGLIPGSGSSPGGGHGNLLQYFRLENDRAVFLHYKGSEPQTLQPIQKHWLLISSNDYGNEGSISIQIINSYPRLLVTYI